MLDFILKYWLQVGLGALVAGLSFTCKKFWSLYKAESVRQHKKEFDDLFNNIKTLLDDEHKRSQADDEVLQIQIDNLTETTDSLKKGLLSIQGKQFMASCEEYLKDGRTITLDEFKDLDADHEAYNSLGGNHNGDKLFSLVQMKFENSLISDSKK